jgi:signal peptidase II
MKKWLFLSAIVIIADQITKYLAASQLVYAEPLPVVPSFNLTLLHNYGAAFSFLNDAGGWQRWFFVALSLGASVLLIAWLRKLKQNQWLLALALALVLGGAVGNLVDRLWHGYVIDFIQLYYGTFYWPAFNIADSAITVGAVILVWDALFVKSAEA